MSIDTEPLRIWFLQEKRAFPWREARSPYRVWVSEVMLQQTQANRVIDYFNRWMERFPTIAELAKSSEDEVCKLWEGLGYYSRARALLQAARFIVEHFDGEIPNNPEDLLKIKGLGPYTTAAILAFGFDQRIAAVDGNVMRVLTRLFAIKADIAKLTTQKELRLLATRLLPNKESATVAEALIELGATICRPKSPSCTRCPLQNQCKGFSQEIATLLPTNSKRIQYEALYRDVTILLSEDAVLLRRGEVGQVMAGLYELPYFPASQGGSSLDELRQRLEQLFGVVPRCLHQLSPVKQSFTRFRVTLYPHLAIVDQRLSIEGYEWYPLSAEETLPFSAGHKKIIQQFKNSSYAKTSG